MKMKITIEEVEHVARLARLEINAEEKRSLTEQMNEILLYMEKLNELDTTGVNPTSHVVDLRNAFRVDLVKESFPRDQILDNAPEDNEAEFIVPRII
jgi:aspartyl-tRNA(Asn)/glutamyl-tRNA(Gln) amidotransferase subunit C